jgi:hypothetical protein
MEKKKLDWIISIIREEMVATGSTAGAPGFSGSANPKGPVAGFDPVMGIVKRKKIIGLGKGSRKRWAPKEKD